MMQTYDLNVTGELRYRESLNVWELFLNIMEVEHYLWCWTREPSPHEVFEFIRAVTIPSPPRFTD